MSENARRDLKEGLVLYNTDNNAGLRDAWNTIQAEVRDIADLLKSNAPLKRYFNAVFSLQWRCCGVMNHNDWYTALHDNMVPDRCCMQFYQGCGRNASNAFWPRVSGEISSLIKKKHFRN